MANGAVPPVRPDAASEDPSARDINPFKQALNTFLYGSRDPSYTDIGEARARGMFQHYTGTGQALAAGARPEVAAQIYAAYANQGQQAAQSMRERYYEKEFRQMMQVQITPLKEQFDAAAANAKTRLQIINVPIPRAVSFEEGKQRAIGAQLLTPTSPETVQTGTTAEGKAKTKTIEGVAPPEPNPAAGPQIMGATEYTSEAMSFTDPVTGQPVPIASMRGRQIEQEVTSELMDQHNKLMTSMMDTFAQYPGNPFAVSAMQKIMDGIIAQSGKAVTGRADPYEQLTWWQEYNEKQADIARKTTEANQMLLDLEVGEATINAAAADALQLAGQDSAFADLLGKKAQKYIKQGTPVEEWDPKTKQETAALAKSQRDLQLKDLQARRQAGMVRIEPKELHIPDTWHSRLQTRDEGYRHRLARRYNEMNNALLQELTMVEHMSPDEQERTMDALGVPADLRNLVRQGALTEDVVTTWIKGKLKGSDEYKDIQTKTYMDTLAEVVQQQPEVFESMEFNNEQFIQEWMQRKRETGMPETEIQEKVDFMRADTLGTHILSTTGENPTDYRPSIFEMKIQDEYTGPRQVAPASALVLDTARRDMYNQPLGEESVGESDMPEDVNLTEEHVTRTNPAFLSQQQLEKAIELLKVERDKLVPIPEEYMNRDPKREEAYQRLNARINDLEKYHENFFERTAIEFFKWNEELGEKREKARLNRERRTEDLLRALPKVN